MATPAEQPEVEQEAPEGTEDDNFELTDEEPEGDDGGEAEEEEDDDLSLSAEDERLAELTARLDRAEREVAESRAFRERYTAGSVQTADAEQKQLAELNKKRQDGTATYDDLIEISKIAQRIESRKIAEEQRRETIAIASSQHARGVLSRENMGAGLDYDTIISTYVEPMEAENPATRQLFMAQKDPAVARYTIGFMMRMSERYKGDLVKTFKSIEKAISAKQRASKEITDRIDAAARSGAEKTRTKEGRPKAGTKKLSPQDIKDMPLSDFEAVRKKMRERAGLS